MKDIFDTKRLVRCMCCKELGHGIDTCPRDPNFKTRENQTTEYERIAKILDYKKYFADTLVQTTHMLKKCVLQPNSVLA